jgi:hypothetical protein
MKPLTRKAPYKFEPYGLLIRHGIHRQVRMWGTFRPIVQSSHPDAVFPGDECDFVNNGYPHH